MKSTSVDLKLKRCVDELCLISREASFDRLMFLQCHVFKQGALRDIPENVLADSYDRAIAGESTEIPGGHHQCTAYADEQDDTVIVIRGIRFQAHVIQYYVIYLYNIDAGLGPRVAKTIYRLSNSQWVRHIQLIVDHNHI